MNPIFYLVCFLALIIAVLLVRGTAIIIRRMSELNRYSNIYQLFSQARVLAGEQYIDYVGQHNTLDEREFVKSAIGRLGVRLEEFRHQINISFSWSVKKVWTTRSKELFKMTNLEDELENLLEAVDDFEEKLDELKAASLVPRTAQIKQNIEFGRKLVEVQ